MTFDGTVEAGARLIEGVGVAIVIGGSFLALARYAWGSARRGVTDDSYRSVRKDVGRAILLGLELLVAADIIQTVTISPSFESVAVLGLIVVIRTFLSMTLEVEIDGRWPWRRSGGGSDRHG